MTRLLLGALVAAIVCMTSGCAPPTSEEVNLCHQQVFHRPKLRLAETRLTYGRMATCMAARGYTLGRWDNICTGRLDDADKPRCYSPDDPIIQFAHKIG
jgi:hypothetical protein